MGGTGGSADRRGHRARVGHAGRPAARARGDRRLGQRAESDVAPDPRPPQCGPDGASEGNPLGSRSARPAPALTIGDYGQETRRRRRRHAGVHSRIDSGPQGTRGGSQASRDVHRLHQRERTAPPGVRGGRQLDRRGAGRPLRHHQRHHPRRQLDHRSGQRARHPGGHAPHREDARRSR